MSRLQARLSAGRDPLTRRHRAEPASANADTAGRHGIARLGEGRWAAHAATPERVTRGGLLDIAVGANDRRVARHQQFNASGAGTNARLAVLQNDRIFQSLDEEIER